MRSKLDHRRSRTYKLIAALALGLAFATACAAPLDVVTVSAPAINCVFEPSCIVTVTDTTAPIPIPTGGSNFLQSRTFMGAPDAPANGFYAYEYRIDLRNAVGSTYIPCLRSMTIDFGPVVSTLDYDGDGTADQVYVVTVGGLGSIGLASAEKAGNNVTFNFNPSVCAGGSPGTGQSTFFFGLLSTQPPEQVVTATVEETTGAVYDVAARAP